MFYGLTPYKTGNRIDNRAREKVVDKKDVAANEPNMEMAVSMKGVELIAKFEGCCLDAYLCPEGVWTIGYGHTAGVRQGDRLRSKREAKALLAEDLKKYSACVNECVRRGMIAFRLTQNQFDALTCFCFHCGSSNLQRLMEGRDAAVIAEKILLFNKADGRERAGLTIRRKEEQALFVRSV